MSEGTPDAGGNRQIARAAGTIMLAIIAGQLLGLLRGILVARAFPPSDLDAFFAANRVAETIFMLVAAGALGSAFIPVFTTLLARDEREDAWRLASSLANLLLVVLSALALTGGILAPWIVRYLLAPGFSADAGHFLLTVELLRLQLASVVLFGLGGLLVGVLNAHRVFFVPALTPSMYQVGLIFGVLVLAPQMGIRGLAWGVVVGALLYLLVQVPALLRVAQSRAHPASGIRHIWTLGLGDARVREVLRLMVPRMLGIGVVQVNFWVNIWLASTMPAGSVAGLQYGFSLMLMAQAAIAQSVAIAAMPTLAAQHALGQLAAFRNSLTASLRGVILLAVPASAGLVILREPIVALLYQRGEFDERMTQLVAWALLWFAAGLLGHAMLEVLTRAFYARHDTRTPVVVGAGAMTLNVLLSFSLSAMFTRSGWLAHGGLALANSIATALETAALYILMRRGVSGLDGSLIGRAAVQAAAGVVGMCAFVVPLSMLQLPIWLTVPAGVALGGMAYYAIMRVLAVPEAVAAAAAIARRLRPAA